jgi:hypothetical protein
MHKEGKAESGANNDYGRVPTLSLHSKPSGGADLRVSRGFGENTRFGGAAAPPKDSFKMRPFRFWDCSQPR